MDIVITRSIHIVRLVFFCIRKSLCLHGWISSFHIVFNFIFQKGQHVPVESLNIASAQLHFLSPNFILAFKSPSDRYVCKPSGLIENILNEATRMKSIHVASK